MRIVRTRLPRRVIPLGLVALFAACPSTPRREGAPSDPTAAPVLSHPATVPAPDRVSETAAPVEHGVPAESGPLERRPAGFATYPSPWEGPYPVLRCGAFEIHATRGDPGMDAGHEVVPRLWLVGPDARVGWSRRGSSWMRTIEAVWCFDVTGDGTPELLVADVSGGTHCCSDEILLSLDTRVRTELHFADGGHGGGLEPVDVGTGPPYPLVGWVDSEGVGVADGLCLSHADRPFFPILLAHRGSRWVRAAGQFPIPLRADRDRALAELDACEHDTEGPAACMCNEAALAFAWSDALGDWPAIRPRVAAVLAGDPIFAGVLDRIPQFVRGRLAHVVR